MHATSWKLHTHSHDKLAEFWMSEAFPVVIFQSNQEQKHSECIKAQLWTVKTKHSFLPRMHLKQPQQSAQLLIYFSACSYNDRL